jgi:acyl-CoA synthetase (AMP-forming)/AMP-acid ligase II
MSVEFGGAGNRVVVDGIATSWAAMEPMRLANPAVVLDDGQARALAAVRTHVATGTEILVAAASRVSAELLGELRANGFHVDGSLPTAGRSAEAGRIWILTSGSTGRPKRVPHTLSSLATVTTRQPPRTWLCPYSPGTYAWWQVVSLSLTTPGQDLVAVAPDAVEGWPALALRHRVTAVSGTPTFWRRSLLQSGDAMRDLDLQQITLGGEPVDQAVLDTLTLVAPRARISWIYASSEVGAAITVHDGRAGFPVSWLGATNPGRPVIDVEGDELVVSSPHAGSGFDGRVRTGDRVEIVGDRVLIVGRRDHDEINVGGMKVSAGLVRDTLLSHPQIQWARVYSRRAPIVGNLVAAEVVTTLDERELTRWARSTLPEYAAPRRFRLLDTIPMKETLKSDV